MIKKIQTSFLFSILFCSLCNAMNQQALWPAESQWPDVELIIGQDEPLLLSTGRGERPSIYLKNIVDNSRVSRFIINEYRKNRYISSALVNKICITAGDSDNYVFDYVVQLNQADYVMDDQGFYYPQINLRTILGNSGVQKYVHAHYQMQKSFIEKYPKTSVIGAAGLGALTVGALWWLKTKK